jgi:hypothetical protein
MNIKFDELTKTMAQSVTRRAAMKNFSLGVVTALAASLGIRSVSAAPKRHGYCAIYPNVPQAGYTGQCVDPTTCQQGITGRCKGGTFNPNILTTPCGWVDLNRECSY